MKEKAIDQDEASRTISQWQSEDRAVEVRLCFGQGVIQTHPGYVTVEPDGRIVIAHVVNKDHYFTTVLDVSAFDSIKLFESENAITFSEPSDSPGAFRSVTVACRQP